MEPKEGSTLIIKWSETINGSEYWYRVVHVINSRREEYVLEEGTLDALGDMSWSCRRSRPNDTAISLVVHLCKIGLINPDKVLTK